MLVARMVLAAGKLRRNAMCSAPSKYCALPELADMGKTSTIDISALRAFAQTAGRTSRQSVMKQVRLAGRTWKKCRVETRFQVHSDGLTIGSVPTPSPRA